MGFAMGQTRLKTALRWKVFMLAVSDYTADTTLSSIIVL